MTNYYNEVDEYAAQWLRNLDPGARTGGAWGDAGWIIGHDGKARRVEPGIRLLVDGLPPWLADGGPTSKTASRQVALKGLGNAIVPSVAAEVIAAYMECWP